MLLLSIDRIEFVDQLFNLLFVVSVFVIKFPTTPSVIAVIPYNAVTPPAAVVAITPILSNSRSWATNLRTFTWACINIFSNSSWTIQYSVGLSGKVVLYLW